MPAVDWIILILGVAVIALGVAPLVRPQNLTGPPPPSARLFPVVAIILAAIVIVLALIRLIY